MATTAEQRRRNVERVKAAVDQLAQVENALADFEARVPALRRAVVSIREEMATVLGVKAPDADTEQEEMQTTFERGGHDGLEDAADTGGAPDAQAGEV